MRLNLVSYPGIIAGKYFLQPLANGARTPHITGIEFDLGRSAVSLGVPPFSHG